MNDNVWLAEAFEANRERLRTVAYRMLGSAQDAEDAVQEAWLRLSRANATEVENLSGWLTTVVSRVCLDALRTRRSRREEPVQDVGSAALVASDDRWHPEQTAHVADSVSLALFVVLDSLAPAERVAFVLHDLFDLSFEEIARVLERTPAATRQLASRARRRVRGSTEPDAATRAREQSLEERTRRRQIVDAFLAASRAGDFEGLLNLLDPSVVLRADAATVMMGGAAETTGARAVAETFAGRARAAVPASIDGSAGLVWSAGGKPRVVFRFAFDSGRITGIEMVADEERLRRMEIVSAAS